MVELCGQRFVKHVGDQHRSRDVVRAAELVECGRVLERGGGQRRGNQHVKHGDERVAAVDELRFQRIVGEVGHRVGKALLDKRQADGRGNGHDAVEHVGVRAAVPRVVRVAQDGDVVVGGTRRFAHHQVVEARRKLPVHRFERVAFLEVAHLEHFCAVLALAVVIVGAAGDAGAVCTRGLRDDVGDFRVHGVGRFQAHVLDVGVDEVQRVGGASGHERHLDVPAEAGVER